MKTIKIGFSGFWRNFDPEKFCLYQVLKKHYDVQICDDPDYVICSSFRFYDYVDKPQVRIFFSSENYTPDFNLIDYGISFYPIDFLDRHYSFPCLVDSFDVIHALEGKSRAYPDSILEQKTYFASLIASHDSENNLRSELFHLLSKYKRVESLGELLYNMPNGEKVSRADGSKREFLKKCKFTLCCESLNHGGFITEKILEALEGDTIPIYYGSSTITDVINRNAFINLADFETLQDAVDRIIELDNDDEQYLQMLRQPIFADPDFMEKKMQGLEEFLCHIFDQPLEKAYRRCHDYMPKYYEDTLRFGKKFICSRDRKYDIRQDLVNTRDRIVDPIIGGAKRLVGSALGDDTLSSLKQKLKDIR